MKAIFRTFESGAGDCIFLMMKDDKDERSYHIMVDCNVLTADIKQFIHDDLNMRIDLLIITHIDSDHTSGIIRMMQNRDFADLEIKQIIFNGFQPQSLAPQSLDLATVGKLKEASKLLPPVIDAENRKTSGMDAACLITELKKHPQWESVWRKTPVVVGDNIVLGEKGEWGNLTFLSPTQAALDDLLHVVHLEYAKKLGVAPPKEDFEDQDKYFELMLRLAELHERPVKPKKTESVFVNKSMLDSLAKKDAEENNVTEANKASLAFYWENSKRSKRVLFMGDAVSSQVVEKLDKVEDGIMTFEAVKVSHHGSKNNTSIGLMKKVDSGQFFVTGGKKGEGPHLEAFSKIATMGTNQRIIHFNHTYNIPLWSVLSKAEVVSLLKSINVTISQKNIHEFEC